MTTDAEAMDAETAQRIAAALGQDPAALRAEADELTGQWTVALASVVQLPQRAEQLRATASALEAVYAARMPVVAAENVVAEAEEAYAGTAGPEEEAAATAARTRHEAERAGDLLEQALAAGVDPERKRELLRDVNETAQVAEWEQQALVVAQDARERAKTDLHAARALLARAHDDIAAKVLALNAPLTSAGRSGDERWASLMTTWPMRVAGRHKPGQAMDDEDLAIARVLCLAAAANLHVCPQAIALDVAMATAQASRRPGAEVDIPFAGKTTFAELLAEADKQRPGGR